MCNDGDLFVELRSLKQPQEVMLGDGHALEATGQGIVALEISFQTAKPRVTNYMMCFMYRSCPTTCSVCQKQQKLERWLDGKMNVQSLSGAEYFLTFIDDKTHYVWMYVLKRKDQVFERFLEWKASSGGKINRSKAEGPAHRQRWRIHFSSV